MGFAEGPQPALDQGRVGQHPAVQGGVIDLKAPLEEQLLDVAITERIAQLPRDRLQDERRLEVPALEIVLRPALQLLDKGVQDHAPPPVRRRKCRPHAQRAANAKTLRQALFNAVPEGRLKTFRARIVHLRRVGIPLGFSPGRGERIAYQLEQVYQLGLCLELEEMGLDPSLISRLMETFWVNMFYPLLIEEEQKLGFSLAPEHIPDDLFFAIYSKFMSGQWDWQPHSDESFPELVDFYPFRIKDANAALSKRRTCTLNLSAFIRA